MLYAAEFSYIHTAKQKQRLVLFKNLTFLYAPSIHQVFARWWSEQQPFVAQFVHDYGSILVHFLSPFSPRAARRAGYCGASQDLLRSLDRVDAELPGVGSGWSSRWRSRSEGVRGKSLHGRIGSVYTAVGGAGVAAVVVIVAAAGARDTTVVVRVTAVLK